MCPFPSLVDLLRDANAENASTRWVMWSCSKSEWRCAEGNARRRGTRRTGEGNTLRYRKVRKSYSLISSQELWPAASLKRFARLPITPAVLYVHQMQCWCWRKDSTKPHQVIFEGHFTNFNILLFSYFSYFTILLFSPFFSHPRVGRGLMAFFRRLNVALATKHAKNALLISIRHQPSNIRHWQRPTVLVLPPRGPYWRDFWGTFNKDLRVIHSMT